MPRSTILTRCLALVMLLAAVTGCEPVERSTPGAGDGTLPATATAVAQLPATAVPTDPMPAAPTAVDTTPPATMRSVPAPTATGAPADDAPADGWASYTNDAVGYSIDYPADWFIQADAGPVVILTTYDPTAAPGRGGVPQDETKIDIAPQEVGLESSLMAMINAQRESAQEVLREEAVELPGGVPAVRMQVISGRGEELPLLLTVIDGTSVQLVGYGGAERFDEVARTLRPAGVPRAEE